MIIALDGQSGTGKSTLAKMIANELNFVYLNTGMIYRSIAYYFIKNGIYSDNLQAIQNLLKNMNINIKFIKNEQKVIINDLDCSDFVSTKEVQQNVSLFSQIKEIREKCVTIQREFALLNNIVIEGRDIGTHVFPNADYKFFIECDIEVSSQRRFEDLKQKDPNVKYEDVLTSLKNRDELE